MRTSLRRALVALAVLFLVWELVGAVQWVRQAGGVGAGLAHLWRTLRADWMALIVVSDHLVVAGVVLVGLWLDAARRGWPASRRLLLALTFIGLGSPALLAYLAWRVGGAERRR